MLNARPKGVVDVSGEARRRRCAIYTRKSSSEGLEQSFTSVDAQREACAAYVASQAAEGWASLDTRYDDGGYSGGTLDRPAIRRLMDDVEAGLIEVVVVYKVDRLSRSLIDFSRLIGIFEDCNVAFVSVTQSFNTTSSMGRLTLNVLLSFAQFERELTSERLRDKFAASRARGLWLSGPRPYGYRVEEGRLSVDPAEADVVRGVFARYPKVGSARVIAEDLTARGILNKFGLPWRKRTITSMLQNRLYRGELPHAGKALPGAHEAIVTERAWQAAQVELAASARRRGALKRGPVPGLLKGVLFGPDGRGMVHTFVHRPAGTYRYYVASHQHRYGAGTDPMWRFRAADLERSVVAAVQGLVPASTRIWSEAEAAGVSRSLVARVDVGVHDVVVQLTTGARVRIAVSGRIGAAFNR